MDLNALIAELRKEGKRRAREEALATMPERYEFPELPARFYLPRAYTPARRAALRRALRQAGNEYVEAREAYTLEVKRIGADGASLPLLRARKEVVERAKEEGLDSVREEAQDRLGEAWFSCYERMWYAKWALGIAALELSIANAACDIRFALPDCAREQVVKLEARGMRAPLRP